MHNSVSVTTLRAHNQEKSSSNIVQHFCTDRLYSPVLDFTFTFRTIPSFPGRTSVTRHIFHLGRFSYHQSTEQYRRLCTAFLFVATSFFASVFENILVGTNSRTAGLMIEQTHIAFGRLSLHERDLAGRRLLRDQE